MEAQSQRGLERVISQRAMQMSSSSSCKIWAVGFLCGVCISYLFMAAITSFRGFGFQIINVPPPPSPTSGDDAHGNSSIATSVASVVTNKTEYLNSAPTKIVKYETFQRSRENTRVDLLYNAWSSILNEPDDEENAYLNNVGLNRSNVPTAPHLEDCKSKEKTNEHFDRHGQRRIGRHERRRVADHPPWIVGSDEDNFPLTRRVQRDLWMHQHPVNCSDVNLRFLVADWEKESGFGMGAQFAGMCGVLAIAMNENRILVTDYYNRADHDGCKGSSRSHWSCYFIPETSAECRTRALQLLKNREAWSSGIVTTKEKYTSKEIWSGRIPRRWGNPWEYMQQTTEIDGSLVVNHRKMDLRWWRAQALRYLMRFESRYTCNLMNTARHSSFGLQAAKMVAHNLPQEWPQAFSKSRSSLEQSVWSNRKPWIPRPLLSMHVRMGDKACEMEVVGFDSYMKLAERIRNRFPFLRSIWLSTEMQEVIDQSRSYQKWNFYYTNVTRQIDNSTMDSYEASLGRETSTNYPLVNFLMASDADFFVGALGSTWCFLIDGMRNTGGKVMSGYLSVNKDRFW